MRELNEHGKKGGGDKEKRGKRDCDENGVERAGSASEDGKVADIAILIQLEL